MKTLRLILGDQLNSQHSWYKSVDNNITYLIAEMRQETDYVKHHIQKVVGFFLAMRNFADHLKSQGRKVIYLKINDTGNAQSLSGVLKDQINKHSIEKFEYQLPDEYRLDQQLKTICKELEIPSEAFDT